MREKEKNAVSAAATAKDGKQMRMDGYPTTPCIVDYTPQSGTMASLLCHDEKNAISTRDISAITGMHPRDVTRKIRQERSDGAPIMSGKNGYWLAEDAEEVRRCAAALHKRAGEIHRTAKSLERLADAET